MSGLHGVYVAVVADLKDPERRGRVRVRVPQIAGLGVSGWAEPAAAGTAAVGDQVAVAFTGGDVNWPMFWPCLRGTQLGWQPLLMRAGWAAHADTQYGRPMARLTGDGMIEVDGAVTATGPVAAGTVPFATLPYGWASLANSYAVAGLTSALEATLGTYVRVGVLADGSVNARFASVPVATASIFMSGLRFRLI